MKSKMISTLVSLFSLIVALALAYGLDQWVEFLRKRRADEFPAIRSLWGITLANWIVAFVIIALIWLVYSIGKNSLVGWCYLVVGLLLSLYPALRFTYPLYEVLPIIRGVLYSPNSYLTHVVTIIAILGGWILLRPKQIKT